MYMGINCTFLIFMVSFAKEIQYPDSYSNFENFEYESRMLTHMWGPNYSKTPILFPYFVFSWILHMFVLFRPNARGSNARFYIPDFALYQNLPFIFLLLTAGLS
jgi:hypothetical protein